MKFINIQKIQGVFVKTVLTFLFIAMIAFLQKTHDDISPPFSYKLEAIKRTLFPSAALPYVTFGFENVISDSYWILAVQDYVQWNAKENSSIDAYLNYFRNISTLDPRFEYPYQFSILAIPVRDDTSKSTLDKLSVIADKGIEAIPTSWKIPFYLATQYFRLTKSVKDSEKYLKIAVTKKEAPAGAYLAYSSLVAKNSNSLRTSQALISVIYNNTDNETIKKIAQTGFQEEVVIQMLEKGILAYKTKYKKYPSTVGELMDNKFISLPDSFFDLFTVTINQWDGGFRVETRR